MSSGKAIAFIWKGGVEQRIEGTTSTFGVERVNKVSAESAFDLASITKIMATTTLLMLAIDRGLINLDLKVSNLFSEWRESDKEDLTLEDLLRHESGLEECCLEQAGLTKTEAFNPVCVFKQACLIDNTQLYLSLHIA
ncbi:MAG: serine hydrolase, partial [Actinomycetota bacterium]